MRCEYCKGKGYELREPNSSLIYFCQDCNGTGDTPDEEECDVCGFLKDIDGDCEHCEENKDINL
jgi:DnaJ-class molecular chaperone